MIVYAILFTSKDVYGDETDEQFIKGSWGGVFFKA